MNVVRFLPAILMSCCGLLLLSALGACRTSRVVPDNAVWPSGVLTGEPFSTSHAGLLVIDPATEEVLIDYNSGRLFTPASNVKLFTALACLSILGDTVASIHYGITGDTLFFSGAADPSFLHPGFARQPAFDLLDREGLHLVYLPRIVSGGRFGPGWAWDDYQTSFSPERSAMPAYGNCAWFVRGESNDSIAVTPGHFRKCTAIDSGDSATTTHITRDEWRNRFVAKLSPGGDAFSISLPFVYSDSLLCRLLSDTLHRCVSIAEDAEITLRAHPGIPLDSLLRPMLTDSDNFLAEQLLLMCADRISGNLDARLAIDWMMEGPMAEHRESLMWVDGSGLSRYNQASPAVVVSVLKKIHQRLPRERWALLLPICDLALPADAVKTNSASIIHAKSGSMRQVFNLSGYLYAGSGRLLIFSFMCNHSEKNANQVRALMEKILSEISTRY